MFRRRSTTERSDELDATTSPTDTVNGSRAVGKGRPTPTRKEAEQARKERVRPALTRRESVRRQREHVRSERGRARQAMSAGDERYFPPRDKGPERRFVRDYVDSRRTLAEFFLPMILIVLVLSLIRSPQIQLLSTLLWLGTMVLVIVDLAIIGVRVKREVRKRFPDDQRRARALRHRPGHPDAQTPAAEADGEARDAGVSEGSRSPHRARRIHRPALAYTDAVVRALEAELQQEYVERYGGADEAPVDPAEFAPPGGVFVVGFADGEPVASGGFRRHNEQIAEIKRMYVVEDRRGVGYARRLLAELEARAAAVGYQQIILETVYASPRRSRSTSPAGTSRFQVSASMRTALSRSFAKDLTRPAERRRTVGQSGACRLIGP